MDKPATRVCRTCGEEKPLDRAHFTPSKGYAGGLRPTCKACRNARTNERRRTDPAFVQAVNARQRAHYARSPERRAAHARYARDWRQRNRDHIAVYQRAYKRRRLAVDTSSAPV